MAVTETPPKPPPADRGITRRVDYFGGSAHGYQLDGRPKTPSVTQLIDKGLPKPGLMNWKGRAVAEYVRDNLDWLKDRTPAEVYDLAYGSTERTRRRATGRGTTIHELAEQVGRGVEVEVPEELIGPVTALVRFLDDWQVTPIAVEFGVINRAWNYMGTADLMCRFGDGRLVLIDYKTGESGLYPEVALQLAGYAWAETYAEHPSQAPLTELPMPLAPGQLPATEAEEGLPRFDLVAALWLRETTYELCPVDAGPTTWQSFLYVAQVAAFAERPREDLVGLPILPPRPVELGQ